jgi:hypothetical protein
VAALLPRSSEPLVRGLPPRGLLRAGKDPEMNSISTSQVGQSTFAFSYVTSATEASCNPPLLHCREGLHLASHDTSMCQSPGYLFLLYLLKPMSAMLPPEKLLRSTPRMIQQCSNTFSRSTCLNPYRACSCSKAVLLVRTNTQSLASGQISFVCPHLLHLSALQSFVCNTHLFIQ